MATKLKLDLDRARALRADGWSYQQIADEFGVDRGTIRRHLNPESRAKENEKARRWREANPLSPEQRAANVEATRKWRAAYPDRHRAAVHRWHERNPGVAAQRTRAAKLADLNVRFSSVRNAAKKRAEAKALPFEAIDLEALAERDSWTCQICLGPIDRTIMDRHNPWNMSIDHVVPESCGGGWTWDNLQLAHYGCNILRGAATIDEVRYFAHEFMRRMAAQALSADSASE